MIALALLLQGAAPPALPADWAALRPLPLTARLPEGDAVSAFVKAEVEAGRCAAVPRTTASGGGAELTVDMAVLVNRGGVIRRIVPRAIDCPTVEQYAVGVVASLTRGNVTPPAADSWFRLSMPFAWR